MTLPYNAVSVVDKILPVSAKGNWSDPFKDQNFMQCNLLLKTVFPKDVGKIKLR